MSVASRVNPAPLNDANCNIIFMITPWEFVTCDLLRDHKGDHEAKDELGLMQRWERV